MQGEARTYAASVGLGADGTNLDPVVAEFGSAMQELRIVVDGVYDYVDVAVVIEIAEGAAASGHGIGDSGPA